MSNQLLVPFKRTTPPPIAQAVRDYISTNHYDTHPEAFEWDVSQWDSLRSDVSKGAVHGTVVDNVLKYHAQLVLLLTKLPVDIGLPITYYQAFQPNSPPVTLSNLAYERVCVLFNLAALLCQIAEIEDRSTAEGIKRACGYFQNAAGAFSYLLESAMPALKSSLTHPLQSTDLAVPVIKSLEYLMLAQAQECYWQKAVMDSYRNSTIARLSMQVASYYSLAYSTIQSASPPSGSVFPSYWTSHFQTKQLHFEAAAQVRKSMDDSENSRYGVELGRLLAARALARKGLETTRRGVANTVVEDINALCCWIEDKMTKAQRDNDLIYHQDIPPVSALEIIEPAVLVNSVILGGLKDPQTALNGEDALFGTLTSWGARTAIEIYAGRKKNAIAKLRQLHQDLEVEASSKLQDLGLPSGLELLDRPQDLPASFLLRASEVRAEDGPLRIRRLLDDVDHLAKQDRDLLGEAYDILDMEAEEDEKCRKRYSGRWRREPSHVANADLVEKAQHYSRVLDEALNTDRTVKRKWDEWRAGIETLASDPETLVMMSSASTSPTSRLPYSPLSTQTKSHARILRGHLESLDEIRRVRQQTLNRAQSLATGDDISDRIKLAAVGFERWTQVKAEMFEDVMGEELDKYDKYREEIETTGITQADLLAKIEDRNVLLQQSRRDDPIVKGQEVMLQHLNTAYNKYKEIIKNLMEGLNFYNTFSPHLTEHRELCKQWSYARREDVNSLVHSLNNLVLENPQHQSPVTPLTEEIPPPPTLSPPGSSPETATSSAPPSPPNSKESKADRVIPRNTQAVITDLPHPNSSQWEPLVPTPAQSPVTRTIGQKSKSRPREGSIGTSSVQASPSIPKGSKPKRQVY